jgi:hypothetical protein
MGPSCGKRREVLEHRKRRGGGVFVILGVLHRNFFLLLLTEISLEVRPKSTNIN